MSDDRAAWYKDGDREVYRASQFGSCMKMLVATRLGYRATAVPGKAQVYFDRGDRHEVACLSVMEQEGWELWDQQAEIELDIGVLVRGHLDSMGSHPSFSMDMPFVVEVKSPVSWQRFIDEIYSDTPSFLTQKYKWQISAYMLVKQCQAMLVCLDETYTLRYHGVEEPFYGLSDFAARIAAIEAQSRVGLPKLCDIRSFPCPVFYLHEDEGSDDEDPFDKDLDIAVVEMKRLAAAAEQRRLDIVAMMEGRDGYKANGVKITRYKRTNTKRDYKGMEKAGYPVDEYTTVTESDVMRIEGPND